MKNDKKINYLDLLFYELAKNHDKVVFANIDPRAFLYFDFLQQMPEDFLIFGEKGMYSINSCPACEFITWSFTECDPPTNWDEYQVNNFAKSYEEEFKDWLDEYRKS